MAEQNLDAERSLAGKIALVTGAARGLGRETARQLALRGAHVILGGRNRDAVNRLAGEFAAQGFQASAITLDVTSAADCQAAFVGIERAHGRLDILINNAGVFLDGPDAGTAPQYAPSETPPDILRQTFNANFFAPVLLTQILLPLLQKADAARIVNVSSIRGSLTHLADPASPVSQIQALAYDSSKAALNVFTVSLAAQLRGTAIRVNSVHPGWVRTEMGGTGADLGIEEGARSAVIYASIPDSGPNGGFFYLDDPLPW